MPHLWTPLDIPNLTSPEIHLSTALDPALFARHAGFTPDAIQAEFLRSTARRGVVCCSRQWGKSTVGALKAVHHALLNPGALIIIVSPALRQSREFIAKGASFLRTQPPGAANCNQYAIYFGNGSRILALPSLEANIRGYSAVSMIFLDEAARIHDDLYEGVFPTLGVSNGSMWLLSTPFGQRGFFYHEWTRGGDHWHRISARADQCERIPKAFLDEQRNRRSERWFRQEYMCEFSSGEQILFPSDVLKNLLVSGYPKLRYD